MKNRAASAVTVPGKKAGPDALKKKGRGGRNSDELGRMMARGLGSVLDESRDRFRAY